MGREAMHIYIHLYPKNFLSGGYFRDGAAVVRKWSKAVGKLLLRCSGCELRANVAEKVGF